MSIISLLISSVNATWFIQGIHWGKGDSVGFIHMKYNTLYRISIHIYFTCDDKDFKGFAPTHMWVTAEGREPRTWSFVYFHPIITWNFVIYLTGHIVGCVCSEIIPFSDNFCSHWRDWTTKILFVKKILFKGIMFCGLFNFQEISSNGHLRWGFKINK